jgi:hypothetical protein
MAKIRGRLAKVPPGSSISTRVLRLGKLIDVPVRIP